MSKIHSTRRNALALLGGLLIVNPGLWARSETTEQDAVLLVHKAADFLRLHGRQKAIEAINTPGGEFHKGDLYVFVYDFGATILAHPANPKLVGKNFLDVPDPDGKYFRRDIVNIARGKGKGWVDYKYKNPESGKIEAKTSYVMTVGDIILAAGIYKR